MNSADARPGRPTTSCTRVNPRPETVATNTAFSGWAPTRTTGPVHRVIATRYTTPTRQPMAISRRCPKRPTTRPRTSSTGTSRPAATPRATPLQMTSSPSCWVTSSGSADTEALFAAMSRTSATMSSGTPGRRTASTSRPPGSASAPGLAGDVARCRINEPVTPMPSTATPAIAQSTERLPSSPMRNAASGGPATQANENTARVRITSCTPAPEARWCAKSSPMPTPAGPPSATRARTAGGSVVDRASAVVRATVKPPHQSIGTR